MKGLILILLLTLCSFNHPPKFKTQLLFSNFQCYYPDGYFMFSNGETFEKVVKITYTTYNTHPHSLYIQDVPKLPQVLFIGNYITTGPTEDSSHVRYYQLIKGASTPNKIEQSRIGFYYYPSDSVHFHTISICDGTKLVHFHLVQELGL